MDTNKLNQVIDALNKKNVNQPCPRCSSNNFSIVGESEITVIKPPPTQNRLGVLAGLTRPPVKTTMPTIIVTCDNCGYVSQHAQASLDLLKARAGLAGARSLGEH